MFRVRRLGYWASAGMDRFLLFVVLTGAYGAFGGFDDLGRFKPVACAFAYVNGSLLAIWADGELAMKPRFISFRPAFILIGSLVMAGAFLVMAPGNRFRL